MCWKRSVFVDVQVQQKSDEEQAQVHIPVAKREDTGKYAVTVSNPFGQDTGLVNVVVLGSSVCLVYDRQTYEMGEAKLVTSDQRILTKGRIAWGWFFTGDNVIWHGPVGSIVLQTAVMPLLRIAWSFPLHTLQQRVPILYSGLDNSPKLLLSVGDLDPHLINTWFLGTTRVRSPNGITIGSAVFAGHIRMTNT